MGSSPTGPGLLFVNSKIISPQLSTSLFTQWYEEEHIPDIFHTSGIKTAYRYYTTSQNPTSIDRPYLALYPLKDVAFLQTTEFRSIPVHSELVPTDNKCIFDLADFDTRYYTNLGKWEDAGQSTGPESFIVAVQFDLPKELGQAEDDDIQRWYLAEHCHDHASSASRVRMYCNYFARQNRLTQDEKQLKEPSKYLALHEFHSEEDMQGFVKNASQHGNDAVASFSLLKAFGNTEHRV